MSSGNLSPNEVKSIVSALEVSPSKSAENSKNQTTGHNYGGKSGASGKESCFHANIPGYGGKGRKK